MNNLKNWSELDDRAVKYARALAMDAVQKAGHGHPGTAMSLAPVAYNLFQRHLIHDPADPNWLGRDRFVLSCGHSSLTLYIQLFYSGYGLEMDDLKTFRTWNSLTPGHPEYGHTAGVEMTTGPLGAGIATAVGMAMAARYERGLFDPSAPTNSSLFDHNVWVLCSDGDLQEGVSSEASSLAGTQQLGNLKVIYDDNRISIEGDTHLAFTEDVSARYRAYGWNVIDVAASADGSVDLMALDAAMVAAKSEVTRPTFQNVLDYRLAGTIGPKYCRIAWFGARCRGNFCHESAPWFRSRRKLCNANRDFKSCAAGKSKRGCDPQELE